MQIARFLSDDFEVEVVLTVKELSKITIQRIQELDILVVAESLLGSAAYWDKSSQFSGTARVNAKNTAGRYMQSQFQAMLMGLGSQAELLKANEGAAVEQAIKDGWKAQKKLFDGETAADKARVSRSPCRFFFSLELNTVSLRR